MKENHWYSENLNLPNNNFEITITDTKTMLWDSLNSDDISKTIDKIIKAYEIVEKDYISYSNNVLKMNDKYKNKEYK